MAINRSVFTGRPAFVNGLLASLEAERESRSYLGQNGARLDDGTPVPEDTIAEPQDIADRVSYPHAWQRGDMILLDNTRFMHGRREVTGEGRKLHVILGDLPALRPQTAAADRRFAMDPHIAATQPRSVLCLPMVHQDRVTGVLYLENNVVHDAFPPALS